MLDGKSCRFGHQYEFWDSLRFLVDLFEFGGKIVGLASGGNAAAAHERN